MLVQILLNIRSFWSILLSELSQNDRPCVPMQPPAHVIGPRYGMQPVPCVSAVNISPGTCTVVSVLFMRRPCLSIPLTLMVGASLRRRCALGEHATKDFARFVWTPIRERLTVRASVLRDSTLPDATGSRYRTQPAHAGVDGHRTTVDSLEV